jgi:rhamnosyltransferase
MSIATIKSTPVADPEVSVVLLTKNAGPGWRSVLEAVTTQILCSPYEVLIIDSTSTDNTIEISKTFPVTIYQIPTESFGHGQTRNLGARLGNGNTIVFLTQDAMPGNAYWLREHLHGLRRDSVAGVFGRQIPRPDARPTEQFSYSMDYPDYDFTIDKNSAMLHSVIFSDVNASIRRSILLLYPFPDDIIASEDVQWASMILRNGYDIAYSSAASVIHSHSYSLATIFQVNFDQGVGHGHAPSLNTQLGKRSILRFHDKLVYLISRHEFRWVMYAIVVDVLRGAAIWLGMHHRYLPGFAKARLGKLHYFWTRRRL